MTEILGPILAILTPVFLLAALFYLLYASILRPKVLLFLLVASFPFLVGVDLSRYTVVKFVFTPSKLFGIWAFLTTVVHAARHGKNPFVFTTEFWVLAALLLTMLTSFFAQGQGSSAWFFQAVSNAMFLMMVAYWADSEEFIRNLKVTFVVAMALSGLYSLLVGDWFGKLGAAWNDDGRLQGTMLNANRAGSYFLVGAAYAWTLAMLYHRKRKMLMVALMAGGGLLLTYFMLLTASRSAFVGYALLMFGLLYLLYQSTRSFFLSGALAVLLAGFLIWQAPDVFLDRVTESFISKTLEQGNLDQEQLGSRYHQYRLAAQLFQKNPILGIGPDNFADEFHRRFTIRRPVHNYYLLIVMDSGLIGLVFYLALLVVSLRHLWVVYRRISVASIQLHALSDLIILGAVVFMGLASTGPTEKQVILCVAASVVLFQLLKKEQQEQDEHPDSSQTSTQSLRDNNLSSFKNLKGGPRME